MQLKYQEEVLQASGTEDSKQRTTNNRTLMKPENSNFTRGSQLWAHNVRMWIQGLRNIMMLGTASCLAVFAVRSFQYLSLHSLYYFAIERYLHLKIALFSFFVPEGKIGVTFYYLEFGKWMSRGAGEFIYKFWNVTGYGKEIGAWLDWLFYDSLIELIASFMAGVLFGLFVFTYRGRNMLGDKKLRGSDIVPVEKLRSILKKAKSASNIENSGLPLVKGSETQHLLLTGTTGAGKTNMLKELLPQIKKQRQRAIVFDLTGEFVDRFYNPETDHILNPLQEGGVGWLPWNDCSTDEEYNSLAAAFVDGESIKTDRYWEDAARSVLTAALKKEKQTKSIELMLEMINRAELGDFCKYFKDTDAAGYVSIEAEKGTASVRSTLISKIEQLKILKDGGDFSIKNWVNGEEDGSWLFVTSSPNDLDTLKKLISAWANIAIKGMLDRHHSGNNDKMWFIMDELPAMEKVPSLPMILAQGRKYGACVVAGIQNIAQLERIYDSSGAKELLDLFRSKFFFAVSDNNIAEYASRSLGEVEISEAKESLSYGSNTMRDGVNINSQQKIKRLVLPDEVKNLKERTCYVKLCGNYPITKLEVKLQDQAVLSKGDDTLFRKRRIDETCKEPITEN